MSSECEGHACMLFFSTSKNPLMCNTRQILCSATSRQSPWPHLLVLPQQREALVPWHQVLPLQLPLLSLRAFSLDQESQGWHRQGPTTPAPLSERYRALQARRSPKLVSGLAGHMANIARLDNLFGETRSKYNMHCLTLACQHD